MPSLSPLKKLGYLLLTGLLAVGVMAGCGGKKEEKKTPGSGSGSDNAITLTLGAYTVPKEAFQEIIPQFQKYWKDKTGQEVEFQESYEASGAQTRAILGGFEADIAVLSLEGDIEKLVEAGLITQDWKTQRYHGMITRSVAALGTREGNPKKIKDWDDLTKPGIKVLYPNPKVSGGAQWDINAIYGAGLKISEERGARDPAFAKSFLARVHKNVKSLDKSGRASMTTFENGIGDVIITYENELVARNLSGGKYNIILPKYTVLIENPAAIVDKNVDKHDTRDVAEAFLEFLWSQDAQKVFAEKGFRPVEPGVARQYASRYKEPEGLFDIGYLGGWKKVKKELYGSGGLWEQILEGR